jgi:hypothetical protein
MSVHNHKIIIINTHTMFYCHLAAIERALLGNWMLFRRWVRAAPGREMRRSLSLRLADSRDELLYASFPWKKHSCGQIFHVTCGGAFFHTRKESARFFLTNYLRFFGFEDKFSPCEKHIQWYLSVQIAYLRVCKGDIYTKNYTSIKKRKYKCKGFLTKYKFLKVC